MRFFARPFCETRCKKRKHKWGRRVPRRETKLLLKCTARSASTNGGDTSRETKLLLKCAARNASINGGDASRVGK